MRRPCAPCRCGPACGVRNARLTVAVDDAGERALVRDARFAVAGDDARPLCTWKLPDACKTASSE